MLADRMIKALSTKTSKRYTILLGISTDWKKEPKICHNN